MRFFFCGFSGVILSFRLSDAVPVYVPVWGFFVVVFLVFLLRVYRFSRFPPFLLCFQAGVSYSPLSYGVCYVGRGLFGQ